MTAETAIPHRRTMARSFRLGDWVAANAIGLAFAYGLYALSSETAESLGAEHGGVGHGLTGLGSMVVGGAIFVLLRHRVLARVPNLSPWTAVVAGIGLASGFVVGYLIAGPPFDFVLGILTLGTIGGGLQWRINRGALDGAGRLLAATVAAWFAGAIAALAVAIVAGDAIDAAAGGGTSGFVAVTSTVGFSAGLVAGVIEGRALRRRLVDPVS